MAVRYLALCGLAATGNGDLDDALRRAYRERPVARVPDAMKTGYSPKYTGTVLSIILLSQLGARVEVDARIEAACAYIMRESLAGGGQFTVNGSPSSTADCLQGNLCAALLERTEPGIAR